MSAPVVIGLSAVIVGVRDREACVLTVRPHDARTSRASALFGLPFGPFDPEGQRTFELAMREFVASQTGFQLGYVEQLYTFGDKGRDAPLADVGAGAARVISVGYLALTPTPGELDSGGSRWAPWNRFFPWEDWRAGRPAVLKDAVVPALQLWAQSEPAAREARLARIRPLFALDGCRWNEERVLERFELLYEAGLVLEAARDRRAAEPPLTHAAFGEPMISDHRRILATGLGRLRGKLKYRPVVFELMPPEFTLSELQRAVEAISGVPLHKQNFRRMLDRTGFVEGLGRVRAETGGRPAELHRFRRERLSEQPALGLSLPGWREG